MPLEQQVQTVLRVKHQAVGFVANPVVLTQEHLPGTNQERQVHCLMHASRCLSCCIFLHKLTQDTGTQPVAISLHVVLLLCGYPGCTQGLSKPM